MPSIVLHQQQAATLSGKPGKPIRQFNPDTPRVLQSGPWQCSAASTAWVLRSLGFAHTQDDVVNLLMAMSPPAISPQDGLESGDGGALVALLGGLGLTARNAWLTFEDALAIAGQKPLAMGGANFYHWVGVRGRTGDVLLLANPDASHYHGVGDSLNRQQFAALGRFAGVWVEI